MTHRRIREQVYEWAERYAICAAQPDVSDEQARRVADCESDAAEDARIGLPVTCTCGAHS